MPDSKTCGLVWFTTNLRVQDNAALNAALTKHGTVAAAYCFDPRHYSVSPFGFKKTGVYRARFIIECVEELRRNLETLGIPLYIALARPEEFLPGLAEQTASKILYHQSEWTPEETDVIDAVRDALPAGMAMEALADQFLFHPDDLEMTAEQVPDVFTSFRLYIEKHARVRAVLQAGVCRNPGAPSASRIPSLSDLGLEDRPVHPNSAFPFSGGESRGYKRLNNYLFQSRRIDTYKQTRNGLVGTDYSSKLSPWLAAGCLSARTVYRAVKRYEREVVSNESTYWLVFELLWRDFFRFMSLKYGAAIFNSGGIQNKQIQWKNDPDAVQRWTEGRTESRFINANMTELRETGWMSNRGRQNAASYFAKTMGLDWRIGAAWFESMLIDHDVHSNYGNWMYVAGVGNDPRDRIFNVKRQAEQYDPDCSFQRLWLRDELF